MFKPRIVIINDKKIYLKTKKKFINKKIIILNIDRSYEAIFDLIDKLDDSSLSTGKSININLIKKALNK